MAENLANDFATTLAGAVDNSTGTLTVVLASGAPAANFRIRVDDELMLVTAVAGTTWTVTRGIEGTAAASHASGAVVVHVLTAGALAALLAASGDMLAATYDPDGDGKIATAQISGLSTVATTGSYNDLANKPDLSLKADLVAGKIPAGQLPGFVDDVLEFANLAAFPATGESDKLYVAVNSANTADPSKSYRWSGTAYTEISPSPGSTTNVPEGTNLYFTAPRAAAAAPVQSVVGQVGAVSAEQIRAALPAAVAGGNAGLLTGADKAALDAKAEKTAIYITATDATASLNAAIAALPSGGTIFITKGVHDITSEITVTVSDIHIIGDAGAVLRRIGAFPIFRVTGNNNTIENLKLDGNRVAYPYPSNSRAAVVTIQGDSNTVTRCVVENSNSHGILFPATGAPDSNVVDTNSIRNCDEIGIAHDSGTDNRILNNRVTGCGYEAISLDHGAYRCIVGDNRLNANCQTGGVGSIGVDGTDLCVIANNVITGTLSGLSGITFQNNLGSSNLNAITGNVLDSNEGYGINLKTGTGGSCSNNTITGNILRSNNTLGSIKIGSGCQGNVLRGNHYGVLPDIDPLSYNQVEPGLVFFYVKNTVARTDVTGDNTSYQIPFNTITQNRNLGSSFNTTTGVFTAPITGLYQLSAGVRTTGGGLHDFLVLQIVTTGGIFANGVDYTDKGAQECAVSGTIFMRKGETAYVSVRVGGDTKTVDITSEGNHNYLTGILVG